jgi:hypothetical protein
MTDRPTNCNDFEVRAILDGRMTIMRRLRWQGRKAADGVGFMESALARAKVGDRLWVREAHALIWPDEDPPERIEDNRVEYRADTDGRCLPGEWPDEERGNPDCPKWHPSTHMPRWASRLTLLVTATKIERVQDVVLTFAVQYRRNAGSPDLMISPP